MCPQVHRDLVVRRCSPDEYRRGPESMVKCSLIDDWLVEEPAASVFHQGISWTLCAALAQLDERGLGTFRFAPCDVWLDPRTVVQPDIFFVLKGRERIIETMGIHGAPDLVVEILSRSTHRLDRIRKRALYAKHGVQEMWLIDPRRHQVDVYRFAESTEQPVQELHEADFLESPLFPAWRVAVARLFARAHPRTKRARHGRTGP